MLFFLVRSCEFVVVVLLWLRTGNATFLDEALGRVVGGPVGWLVGGTCKL